MRKKAQITLMIIIGTIVVTSVAIVTWWTGKTATRVTVEQPGQIKLRQVAVQPVSVYINDCLDLTIMNALELLGRQGGVIYQSQGGLTSDFKPEEEGVKFVNYDGYKVAYSIIPPVGSSGPFFADPPRYPFTTFPYIFKNDDPSTGTVLKNQFIGYYGLSRLAPLLKPGKESIQEQLESYINANLQKCTDWSKFEPAGLSVSAGVPSTRVVISETLETIATEKYFTVLVDWPVTVTDRTTGGSTIIREFSLGYPIHLARFYLFVKGIVDGEVNDITYDPRKASTPVNPVSVVENVYSSPDGGDDVIIIQDKESLLRGKPFEFRIARKNRPPALGWIDQVKLDDYAFVPAGTCSDAASIFLSQDNLLIKFGTPGDWSAVLTAWDPDEDVVSFRTKPDAPIKVYVSRTS